MHWVEGWAALRAVRASCIALPASKIRCSRAACGHGAKLGACHSRRLLTVTINYKILHKIACVAFVADAKGPASIQSLNSIGPARPTRQVKGGRNGCR